MAELGGVEKEIVGVIRGCIKTVTCGKKLSRANGIITASEQDDHSDNKVIITPVCTKLAYILGLRVSPFHRFVSITTGFGMSKMKKIIYL